MPRRIATRLFATMRVPFSVMIVQVDTHGPERLRDRIVAFDVLGHLREEFFLSADAFGQVGKLRTVYDDARILGDKLREKLSPP